ncbi:hypothetical protein MLD38_001766 [Melastoma candidum]|uniref:Uncharacterized protein n=1 Tax=Melastoma candidum TaxID=119954 RepID=A0ACB9SDL8_9MYRT|nr:hypothetical protein MLD38_001766 [Melastoma candidum]
MDPKPTTATPPGEEDNEVVAELLPLIRVKKDGTVERLRGTDFVPPSIDPVNGVSSKDITLEVQFRSLEARIFLPTNVKQRLPLFVHYHGGGFCVSSPFNSVFNGFLATLAGTARAVVISVNYRKAPEHPIPAAYEDSWETLLWVAEHRHGKGPESWLNNHVDFQRLFLGGESAGGNIAHNVAMRAGSSNVWAGLGLDIAGVMLIHPYFWGSHPIGSELLDPEKKAINDSLWPFICPLSPSNDDPWVNPVSYMAPSLEWLGCQRLLVCVAEKDILRDRGRLYYEALCRSGWMGMAEIFESEGEDHTFHLTDTESENTKSLMKYLDGFLNSDLF